MTKTTIWVAVLIVLLSILMSCSSSKTLPNGRPKFQGCQQGRVW